MAALLLFFAGLNFSCFLSNMWIAFRSKEFNPFCFLVGTFNLLVAVVDLYAFTLYY